MPDDEYTFTTLHSRTDLVRESAIFLNSEWPRSDGSREHSQIKSCRSAPPMSFLLVRGRTDEIVGHARVCRLPNRSNALWIESVMISKSLRGKKLGKRLMHEVEQWMLDNGFEEAFLSTEDQVRFYQSCGYVECDPIIHSTTATTVFPAMEQLQSKLDTQISCQVVSSRSPADLSANIPPPPSLPPPPIKKSVGTITTIDHQYMRKQLI